MLPRLCGVILPVPPFFFGVVFTLSFFSPTIPCRRTFFLAPGGGGRGPCRAVPQHPPWSAVAARVWGVVSWLSGVSVCSSSINSRSCSAVCGVGVVAVMPRPLSGRTSHSWYGRRAPPALAIDMAALCVSTRLLKVSDLFARRLAGFLRRLTSSEGRDKATRACFPPPLSSTRGTR